ncbi:hypothetical protein [Streptomyces sp. NPDC006170]
MVVVVGTARGHDHLHALGRPGSISSDRLRRHRPTLRSLPRLTSP